MICDTCTKQPECRTLPAVVDGRELCGYYNPTTNEIDKRILDLKSDIQKHKECADQTVKADKGKPPICLLDRDFLEGTAQVMAFGAGKYSRNAWRRGIAHTRLLDAAMRHIIAIIDGEDIDPESGLPHRHHACASLNMYCGMTVIRPDLDDRWKEEK